jgi:KDO2-lipid IV(A) lauroyltransferase
MKASIINFTSHLSVREFIPTVIEKYIQQSFKEPERMRGKFTTFISSIPYKHIARIGGMLGMLMFLIDVRHRRIVRRNLKFVYPEWPPERVKKVSKRVFQNLGITILEICQMICFSRDDILKKVKIRGEEHLFNAMHNNKGVILISAHLGNWEIVPLFWPLYFNTPNTIVARKIRNKIINRWIYELRTRFGSRVIYKDVALPEMTRALRQGKILGILIDQGMKSSIGVKIRFFNKFVTATPGAALLAMRCKSPVLPVFCTRNDDGTFTINIEPPLVLKKTGDLSADLRTNTQIMTDAIEKAVRKYPEQWFWVHKRWKKYYPYLYKEDLEKKRRKREKEKRRELMLRK